MDASGRTASKVNFSADGESRLRGRVNEKLKEFMGDYTDNTLVDYVIVLLRNGRQKEHARRELDVFLGDDAESFVSWLWDHLTTNLHLYMQSIGDAGVEELGKQVPLLDIASGDSESLFDHEKEKPARSRIRHNKEWKGLVHDDTKPIIMRSTIDDDGKFNDWHRSPVKESSSSKAQIQRKRDREDDESTLKREAATRPKLVASRRLLQFALRDAVRTVQKVSPRPEPSLKRLRSIVSTSTFDTFSDEQPQRTKSIAITARAASIAVKAAADAAEDVFKSKGSGNVFDRLSHGSGGSYVYIKNPTAVEENEEGEDFDHNSRLKEYQQRGENMMGRDARHPTTVEGRTMLTSDSDSEDEDYTNMDSLNWANERSRSAEISSLEKDKDVTMTQQSIAQTADEATNTTLSSNVTPPITGSNALQKTLNISINVNTWKPQDYQEPDQHKEVRNQVNLQGKVEGTPKLNAQVIKDSCMDAPKKDETVRGSDPNGVKKPLPSSHGTYSGGRPADDADSRTVFVSNVHFAATKDTLSRHFNKFGEVLKVIIVTDATTGQPKGSAYVEFLRKESAELALSLNGTSFMSRIMKVVMRSAAHHEAAAMLSWPRMARSAFPSRLGRMAYSRGLMATNLRSRLTVKPGPRSLQWKRDNPGSANDEHKHLQNPSTPGGAAISPGGRNLTYIRPETKTDGRVGPG